MGIVKIDDELHQEVRQASAVMMRSINAQAAFWIKIGMLAEKNPSLSFTQLMRAQMKDAIEFEVDARAEAGAVSDD